MPVGRDGRRDGRLARLRLERRAETLVGQERGVDPAREVAQILERGVRLGAELRRELAIPLGVLARGLFQESQLHRERNQLLLGAVVQVPFDLASLVVLRGHQALARRSQLLDQTDVPQDRACLGGEIVHELPAGRIERIVRRHRDLEGTQFFTLMNDRDEEVRGSARLAERSCLEPLSTDGDEHPGRRCTGATSQDLRHTGKDVIHVVRAANPTAEFRQHLVRGRSRVVYDAVGEPTSEASQRPEQRADDDTNDEDVPFCRCHSGPDDRERKQKDGAQRDQGQGSRHDREDNGLLDHDVEIPEVVPVDRDQVRRGDPDHDESRHEGEQKVGVDTTDARVVDVEEDARDNPGAEDDDEQDPREARDEDEPTELLPFVPARALEAASNAEDRCDREDHRDHAADPGDRGGDPR
jgi:hypothetical protein